MSEEQLDRRSLLEAAYEEAEESNDEQPLEVQEVLPEDNAEESVEAEVSNDDHEEPAEDIQAAKSEESDEEPQEKQVSRPSTWKKEYVQIWDKMEAGEQISKEDFVKFAEYANQRESEYKKGVSTYKAEADRAKSYENAIAPYAQDLQKRGIQPTQYIENLVRAEQILSNAPYEQKVQVFQRLAGNALNQDQHAPDGMVRGQV